MQQNRPTAQLAGTEQLIWNAGVQLPIAEIGPD